MGAKVAGAASTVTYGARKYAGKGANLGLKGVSAEMMKKIVIAYEPVWAIGDGATPCTPEEPSGWAPIDSQYSLLIMSDSPFAWGAEGGLV